MQPAQADAIDAYVDVDLMWLMNSLGPGGVRAPSTDSVTPMMEEPLDVPASAASSAQTPLPLPALPPDAERCWGAEVSGDVSRCVPGFKLGKAREECTIRTEAMLSLRAAAE